LGRLGRRMRGGVGGGLVTAIERGREVGVI
jgi:hypothetical protein